MTQQHTGGSDQYYVFDPMGNTRLLLSSSNTVVKSYLYKAFGEELANTGSALSVFGYGGQVGYYRDVSTRLYVRARHLDTGKGRWISRDPIGFRGKWNLYGYVNNDPVITLDPSGLSLATILFCFTYVNSVSKDPNKSGLATINPLSFAQCVVASVDNHLKDRVNASKTECECLNTLKDKFTDPKTLLELFKPVAECLKEGTTKSLSSFLSCIFDKTLTDLGTACAEANIKNLLQQILINCARNNIQFIVPKNDSSQCQLILGEVLDNGDRSPL